MRRGPFRHGSYYCGISCPIMSLIDCSMLATCSRLFALCAGRALGHSSEFIRQHFPFYFYFSTSILDPCSSAGVLIVCVMARKYHPHSDIIKTLILSMGISSHNWRALGTPMERAASLTQLGISDSSNVPNQGHMSLQLVGVTHGVHLAPATIVTPCLIGWYGPKSAVDQKTTPSNPLSPAAEPFIPAPPKSSLQSDFLGAHELAENPSADHQQISDSSSSGRAWNPVSLQIFA